MNAAQTAARLCLPASRSALSGEIVVFVMSLLRWIYSVTPAALIGLSLTDVEERETGEVFLLPLKTLFRVSLLSERLLLLDVFFFFVGIQSLLLLSDRLHLLTSQLSKTL